MHFRIKPEILRKIREKHNIEVYEIYEVLEGRFLFTRVGRERYRIIGRCYSGRSLTMYLDKRRDCFDLVTARKSEDSEKRFYKKEIM